MSLYRIQHITGRNVTASSSAVLKIAGPKKYVLIAGLDYPSHTNRYILKYSFISYINTYKSKILATRRSGEAMEFITVDIKAGKIATTEISGDGKSKVTIITTDAVTPDNYQSTDYRFLSNGKTNIISNRKIYEIIEKIGVDEPNSVLDMSIFSHAYFKGPILLSV